jgi:Protein of unknown function (DUF3105)
VASRKEQKEALRREREERERAAKEAERRRRLIGYGAAGALVAAALVAVAVIFLAGGGDDGGSATADLLPDGGSVPEVKSTNLSAAAKAADCETKSFKADSRDHTGDPATRVRYPTNPPAAGRHFQFPADDGAYSKAPPDTEIVHSQEHGRVIIWFKPTLPESDRADLKALFDKEKGYQLLLVPRRDMPYAVAETAWNAAPEPLGTGRLLGCPTLTEKSWDALQVFIQDNRGNGPEPVP